MQDPRSSTISPLLRVGKDPLPLYSIRESAPTKTRHAPARFGRVAGRLPPPSRFVSTTRCGGRSSAVSCRIFPRQTVSPRHIISVTSAPWLSSLLPSWLHPDIWGQVPGNHPGLLLTASHLLLHANTETNIEAGDITPEYQQKPNSYLAESGEDKVGHRRIL